MLSTIRPTGLFIAALLSAGAATALADEDAHRAPATQATTPPATQPATQPDTQATETIDGYTHAPYPLTTCVVSGAKLDVMGEPYVIQVDGREVQLCCKGCEDKVRADPATHFKKIDQAVIQQQLGSYPLTTCLIDKSEALGEDAVDVVWKNRLIRFCCPSCSKEFMADPATHLKDLNQAVIDSQIASYPMDTCVVSGDKLSSVDQPINHVVGHRLVRLCCKGCVKDLSAAPGKYLAILDAAAIDRDDTDGGTSESHSEETDDREHHSDEHAQDHSGHDSHQGHDEH